MLRRFAYVAIALVLAACGDDGAPADSGTIDRDAGVDAGTTIVEPVAPALPAIAPCPPGWSEVPGEPPTCEPWPAGTTTTCGAGEARYPGDAACVPIGVACPAGDFADGLDAEPGPVLYVRPGAPAGGDGSPAAPYARIAEAVSRAGAGTTVALAKGMYDELVGLRSGITLRGACAAETRIASTASPDPTSGIVATTGTGVVIRDLTIAGQRIGVFAGGGTTLEGVSIEAASAGLLVRPGVTVTARSVAIRATQPRTGGTFGMGVLAEDGATLTVERAVLEANTSAGVVALGATVHLTDVAIRDTRAQPADGTTGNGIAALDGAVVEATRVVVEESHEVAVSLLAGSTVTLRESLVRDTRPSARDDTEGRAAYAIEGSRLRLERTAIERSREVAILVSDPATSLELLDVIVRDTASQVSDGTGGSGLALQDGATATLSRVLFAANRGASVILFGAGTYIALEDVTIRDTESQLVDGSRGTGLHVQGGAAVDGLRVRVASSREFGIGAFEPGSSVVLSDVAIADTAERACAAPGGTCPDVGFGDGVISAIDARVELTRFAIERSARAGIVVVNAHADLHEGVVAMNPIGANVQDPTFDTARLQDRVVFRDNVRNLDSSAMAIPEPRVGF